MGQMYLRHVFGSMAPFSPAAAAHASCPEEMQNDRHLRKQVVLGEECPSDDADVHPDTKELTEAANLS